MNSIQSIFGHYQKRFQSLHQHGFGLPKPKDSLKLVITIPAFKEDLDDTFQSLSQCTLFDPEQVELVLVLNNSEAASFEIQDLHKQQWEFWNGKILKNGLVVHAIWASDLPKKQAGVGLARKIAMDVALQRFSEMGYDGFIHCLDGDCTVNPNYIRALLKAEQKGFNGLTTSFEHLLGSLSAERQEAIVRYEIFLRYYVEALKWAEYPHAYHTIGSCMGVRASMYGKLGGMNKRKAGEDFYFLHKLIPQGNFAQVNEAVVFPSARNSDRVPFGTGRAMLDIEHGTKSFQSLYDPKIFEELRAVHQSIEHPSKIFFDFLDEHKWQASYKSLKERSQDPTQLKRNFFFWWDGFKVLKFVHWRQESMAPLPVLKAAGELDQSLVSTSEIELLTKLRLRQ